MNTPNSKLKTILIILILIFSSVQITLILNEENEVIDQNKNFDVEIFPSSSSSLQKSKSKDLADDTSVSDSPVFKTKNHLTNNRFNIFQGGWDSIKLAQYGQFMNNPQSVDINGNLYPEIIVQHDGNFGPQDVGISGKTRILEYNPTTGGFTKLLLNMNSVNTRYSLYPIDPFNNGSIFFLVVDEPSNAGSYYLAKYSSGSLIPVSSSNSKFGLINNLVEYNFDFSAGVDLQTDLFTTFSNTQGNWLRQEFSEIGGAIQTQSYPSSVGYSTFISDTDLDGSQELVIVNSTSFTVYEFNSGSNTFTSSFSADLGNKALGAYSYDYDRDGAINIVTLSIPVLNGDIRIKSWEWNSSLSTYVAQNDEVTETGLSFYDNTVNPGVNIFGDGKITSIFLGQRGTNPELGYFVYEGGQFTYKTLFNSPNANPRAVPVQIDADQVYEFVISYTNATDGKIWNQILNYNQKQFDLTIDQRFNNDIFLGGNPWGRTDFSVTTDTNAQVLRIDADGTAGDFAQFQLPKQTKIIEFRSRVVINGNGYKLPMFQIRNTVGSYAFQVGYHNGLNTGSGWAVNTFQDIFNGPATEGTWWDIKLVLGPLGVIVFAKSISQETWTYIDSVQYIGTPNNIFRFIEPVNGVFELDFIRVWSKAPNSAISEGFDSGSLSVNDWTFTNNKLANDWFVVNDNGSKFLMDLNLASVAAHDINVTAVSISKNNKKIATAGEDNLLKIWNYTSGNLISEFSGFTIIRAIDWSSNYKYVAVADSIGQIRVINTNTRNTLWSKVGHGGGVINTLQFSPDGTKLATGGRDNTVMIWDTATGGLLTTYNGHTGWVNDLSWRPDGQFLLSASMDRTVREWNISSGISTRIINEVDQVHSIAYAPNGTVFALGLGDSIPYLRFYSEATQSIIYTITTFTSKVKSIGWSPDSRKLLANSKSEFRIYDSNTGLFEQSYLNSINKAATMVDWSSSGSFVALAYNSTLQLISTYFGPDSQSFVSNTLINDIDISPNNKQFAIVTDIGSLIVYNTASRLKIINKVVESTSANTVAWSNNGSLIATAGWDNVIRIFRVSDWTLTRTLSGRHTALINDIKFAPDDLSIVSVSDDWTGVVWDTNSGAAIYTFIDSSAGIKSVDWSRDGQFIALGSLDNFVYIYRSADFGLDQAYSHTQGVYSIEFSPDSRYILSGGLDLALIIYDTATLTTNLTLPAAHGPQISDVAWSADGTTFISVGFDGILNVWNWQGTNIQTYNQHVSQINTLDLSPNGEFFISASGSGISPGDLIIWQKELQTFITDAADIIRDFTFSPDYTMYATASRDQIIRVYESNTNTIIFDFFSRAIEPLSIDWSPTGDFLAIGYIDGVVEIIDLSTLVPVMTINRIYQIWDVTWSNNGYYLAIGEGKSLSGFISSLSLWKTDTWTMVWSNSVFNAGIFEIDFNPNDKFLAASGYDGFVRIFSVSDGINTLTLTSHTDFVGKVAWSPDGSKIATISRDNFMYISDFPSGNLLRTVNLVNADDGALEWSPDGSLIAASSSSNLIVYNVEDDIIVGYLLGHTNTIAEIDWNQDKIYSVGNDGFLLIWNVPSSTKKLSTNTVNNRIGYKSNLVNLNTDFIFAFDFYVGYNYSTVEFGSELFDDLNQQSSTPFGLFVQNPISGLFELRVLDQKIGITIAKGIGYQLTIMGYQGSIFVLLNGVELMSFPILLDFARTYFFTLAAKGLFNGPANVAYDNIYFNDIILTEDFETGILDPYALYLEKSANDPQWNFAPSFDGTIALEHIYNGSIIGQTDNNHLYTVDSINIRSIFQVSVDGYATAFTRFKLGLSISNGTSTFPLGMIDNGLLQLLLLGNSIAYNSALDTLYQFDVRGNGTYISVFINNVFILSSPIPNSIDGYFKIGFNSQGDAGTSVYTLYDNIFITAEDVHTNELPTISSPADQEWKTGTVGHDIIWNGNDDNGVFNSSLRLYDILRNGTSVQSGNWMNSIPTSINLDAMPVGVWNFTIVIFEEERRSVLDTVIVKIRESDAPVFTQFAADLAYEEGVTSNILVWTATDANPNFYQIEKNGVPQSGGGWASGVAIGINVDGLGVGNYNYTIIVDDLYGNSNFDSANVTVTDTVYPVIDNPVDITYEYGSTSNIISWTGTDNNANNYTLFRNGTQIQNGSWSSGTPLNFNIDGLSIGTYLYELKIEDTSGNFVIDAVLAIVVDTTLPSINNPTDQSIELGSGGNILSWTATDLSPNNYVIYKDGILYSNGTWSSGIAINASIDGFLLGTYNMTIIIYDQSGNSNTDTVLVNVVDTTAPTINNPPDQSYNESTTGNYIVWNATDFNPSNYTVYKNSTVFQNGTWMSGIPINVTIDGLSIGIYYFTINVYDNSGNSITDIVWVTVNDVTTPIVDTPIDQTISEGTIGNYVIWNATDTNPDTYTVYQNGSIYTSGTWTSGVPINISIDGLSLGTYNFSIVVRDVSGNSVLDTLIVTVIDTTNPVVDNPIDQTIEYGSTGNSIVWTATDLNALNYTILKDGNTYQNGTWTSGTPITVLIDGLSLGTYNFSIIVTDTSNNQVSDSLLITVLDTTSPTVSSPADLSYTEGNTGNIISWTANDLAAFNYSIYRNNVLIQNGTWTNGSSVSISVDGLSFGIYNFTILFSDTSNNTISDQVNVTVTDPNPPIVDTPIDQTISEGTIGNYITWNAIDTNPDTYIVYQNGSIYTSGTWTSGVPINISIDGLSLGNYNFSIVINDVSGNQVSDEVIIKILDTTSPVVSGPNDFSYNEGATGNLISWSPSDTHSSIYTVYRNGVIFSSGSWSSGINITINVDGLSVSTYNFTIIVTDTSGNSANDTVLVTVNDITAPTTDSPTDFSYELGSTTNTIVWIGSDSNADTYSVYRNGTFVSSGTWTSGVGVSINIDGLSRGIYNYTIIFFDTSTNSVVDTVLVSVVDTTAPTISSPADMSYIESTTGNTISWTVSDLNTSTYEIYVDNLLNITASWTNGVISFNVDGLTIGIHNITIIIFDGAGNSISDQVNVTVTDPSPPVVSNPIDINFEDGSIGNQIIWNANDTNPDTYTVYLNGSLYNSSTWVSGVNIIITIDGLSVGIYNFTIVVRDVSSNQIIDTVIVTVVDTTSPIISNSSDQTVIEGSAGNTLNWTVGDRNPDYYDVTNNGSLFLTNIVWSNGTITINIDGFSLGDNIILITLYDKSGNIITDTVIISVIDTTNPIINSPFDQTISEGTTGNSINWTITDLHAGNYSIYQNGSLIQNGVWSSGVNVVITIDNLALGDYNYTIIASDTSGNLVSDTVIISIIDTTLPTINSPVDVSYIEGSTGNTISWTVSDLHPAVYNITVDGINVVINAIWISGTISYTVDGLAQGTHTVTIIIYDTEGNSQSDSVSVVVTDAIAPIIISSPSTLSYAEGSTGNNINITLNEQNPSYYDFIVDGATISTGNAWVNGTNLISLDGISYGSHNIELIFYDVSGNSVSQIISVTIYDNTSPIISTPADRSVSEGSLGNTISWTVSDLNPGTYNVTMNGVIYVLPQAWTAGTISIDIDGLTIGSYTFIIFVTDIDNNLSNDTVVVTVVDDVAPIVDSPANVVYGQGSTGNTISWIVGDTNPNVYNITLDGAIYTPTSPWSNGTITINIDGLSEGIYSFIIFVYDDGGNLSTDLVLVTVTDTIPPVVNSPPDLSYVDGSTGNVIIWQLNDSNPDIYLVELDGVSFISATSWTNGTVSINVDGLSVGTYNFTIIVLDQAANSNTDTVIVTVLDTTSPSISNPSDQTIIEGSAGNSIVWTVGDKYPDTYIVYLNGSIYVSNTLWTNGSISISIDGLSLGNYNLTIILSDSSSNSVSDSVIISVIDTTLPVVIDSPVDFSMNAGSSVELIWNVTDTNPAGYNIYVDGSLIVSGTWTNSISYTYSTSLSDAGIHTIQIDIYDSSNNIIQQTLTVNVIEDIISPTISSSGDVIIEEGTDGSFNFTLFDEFPANYNISVDGIIVESGVWTNGDLLFNYGSSLTLGVYNITIFVTDLSGNVNSSSVLLSVIDSTLPSISGPVDITTQLGINIDLNFEVSDLHPSNYSIYLNGSLVSSGTWDTSNITYSFNSIELGVFNITLVVIDLSDNQNSFTTIITVIDSGIDLFATSGDITIDENDVVTIFFNATDSARSNYSLYLDGLLIETGIWNWTLYNITISGFDFGSYVYTMQVTDLSGNTLSGDISITITDLVDPSVIGEGTVFVLFNITTSVSANWTINEFNPSFFGLYRNGTLLRSGSFNNSFFSYNVTSFELGNWNLTLVITDQFGNTGSDIVWVVVTLIEESPPEIISIPDDVLMHMDDNSTLLIWTVQEEYPGTYEIYIDGILVETGSYGNTSGLQLDQITYTISFVFQPSEVKDYEIVLVVKDQWGLITTSKTITIFVLPPVIELSPEVRENNDLVIAITQEDYEIVWVVNEDNPESYQISIDGVNDTRKSWAKSALIKLKLDLVEMGIGVHTIILYVTNQDGYTSIDIVIVTIKEGLQEESSGGFLPGMTLNIIMLLAFAFSVELRRRKNRRVY